MTDTKFVYIGFVLFQIFIVFAAIALLVKPQLFMQKSEDIGVYLHAHSGSMVLVIIIIIGVVMLSMMGRWVSTKPQ
jgi:hypothetical protein